MMSKDSGNWLSAQQAVQPDGTVVENLPLVNKKLPPLVPQAEPVITVTLPAAGIQALTSVLAHLRAEDLRKLVSSDAEARAALSAAGLLQAALEDYFS
ncbi:MAG: hypothetical protein HYS18_02335 [Burkholderiales bacterium]|nr:hypothetical protein [Burkholderiales bacterium]